MEVSPTGRQQPGSQTPSGQMPTDPAALFQMMLQMQSATNESLRQLVEQNRALLELTKETVQISRDQRARQSQELERWQNSHQAVLFETRGVLKTLEQVHGQIMEQLVAFVHENETELMDGEFTLADFTDRFGPRLGHLNTILSVLRPLAALAQHQQAETRNKPRED
jgi:hypothetical protein